MSQPVRRRLSRLLALLGVLGLVAAALLTVLAAAGRQRVDDPRSTTAAGSGALGRLLADAGVEVQTVDRSDQALALVRPDSVLVVANGQQLPPAAARRLLAAGASRVVLLRPGTPALLRFGLPVEGVAPADAVLTPSCPLPAAARAGAVAFSEVRASYQPTGAASATCYPTGAGFALVRTSTAGGVVVDVLAGGLGNAELGQEGNAALGLNLLGTAPRVVWLVAGDEQPPPAAGPTLLPPAWEMAGVQAAVGLLAVAVWRGRRLGPVLTEPLPVTVRAAETVEGHGRLYHRIGARDRAAEALRADTRRRLGEAYGLAADDPGLPGVVADRTGRPPAGAAQLLAGHPPATDDDLVTLARDLDHLEQEARRP